MNPLVIGAVIATGLSSWWSNKKTGSWNPLALVDAARYPNQGNRTDWEIVPNAAPANWALVGTGITPQKLVEMHGVVGLLMKRRSTGEKTTLPVETYQLMDDGVTMRGLVVYPKSSQIVQEGVLSEADKSLIKAMGPKDWGPLISTPVTYKLGDVFTILES